MGGDGVLAVAEVGGGQGSGEVDDDGSEAEAGTVVVEAFAVGVGEALVAGKISSHPALLRFGATAEPLDPDAFGARRLLLFGGDLPLLPHAPERPVERRDLEAGPSVRARLGLLEERAAYARFWLQSYAPEEYRYELQESLPKVELSDTQKAALHRLHEYLKEEARSGEDIQNYLFELKEAVPIKPAELFSAIYQIFLARASGPKAGWFLSVLPREKVLKRLEEVGR